jgi:hypothetical protein
MIKDHHPGILPDQRGITEVVANLKWLDDGSRTQTAKIPIFTNIGLQKTSPAVRSGPERLTMKTPHNRYFLATALIGAVAFIATLTRAADFTGSVQGANSPIAGSTVTLYAASSAAPVQLAQGKTDDHGTFKLDARQAPTNSVLYVVAKGGTPQAAADKGPNDAIGLMAVLGTSLPATVTVNEFSTVASVWTSAQFLTGETLSGNRLGLRIAADNVPNFVDLQTGGYGGTIQDALNSGQTPTMANFATLANLLAGCITQVTPQSCSNFFALATPPEGGVPKNTLEAAVSIARHPWNQPKKIFALLDNFYPVPKDKNLRPTPFMPYLTWAPSAWVLPLKFTGGGLSAPGKMMLDSEGNLWAGDNFIVGFQNQDALWAGNLTKLAPNGKPLSPMTTASLAAGWKASASACAWTPMIIAGRQLMAARLSSNLTRQANRSRRPAAGRLADASA